MLNLSVSEFKCRSDNDETFDLFFLSLNSFAEAPEYCQSEAALGCIEDISAISDPKMGGVLTISESLDQFEFEQNLKRTAMVSLINQKANMLAPYQSLYPDTDPTHAIYKQGLGHDQKRTGQSSRHNDNKTGYHRTCFNDDPQLLGAMNAIEGQFDTSRERMQTREQRIRLLAGHILGAVAGEEGIRRRPLLTQEIESKAKGIEIRKHLIAAGPFGESTNLGPDPIAMPLSTTPCQALSIGEQADQRCRQYENDLAFKFPLEIEALGQEIEVLEQARAEIDTKILSNPFYVEPSNIIDHSQNFFGRLFGVTDENLGEYRKSEFLETGMEKVRSKLGADTVSEIRQKIENLAQSESLNGSSGIEMAQYAIEQFLSGNEDLFNELEDLLVVEIEQQVETIDKSMERLCKGIIRS